ncbi:MAG TPA: C4-type zinc ribbon domain-containing protein [Actinomycetota bacterium]|nr:C4-type zinc ribbon domain-containing protein [Actinomycetota bacterium]
MQGMDRLLELQELDSAVDRLERRRDQLAAGEELGVARKQMEEAESRLGEIRLALDAVARESTRLEHEIESIQAKLAAENVRMYDGSIANPKELEALQHEIASLTQRRSRAEDDLLEQMVRREDLESRATEAEAEVTASRGRVDEIGGESGQELERIEGELAERRAARGALVGEFDEELLELYEDLRHQKRGIGAAAIVDGVCQACHEKLSAVELDRLKRTDEIKRCEYCRRIVVFS